MKKIYAMPQMAVMTVEPVTMVCTSRGVGGTQGEPGEDIGYGGVDEEGTKDPSVRRRDLWDEEEEQEF